MYLAFLALLIAVNLGIDIGLPSKMTDVFRSYCIFDCRQPLNRHRNSIQLETYLAFLAFVIAVNLSIDTEAKTGTVRIPTNRTAYSGFCSSACYLIANLGLPLPNSSS
jgi:hypothetical protein